MLKRQMLATCVFILTLILLTSCGQESTTDKSFRESPSPATDTLDQKTPTTDMENTEFSEDESSFAKEPLDEMETLQLFYDEFSNEGTYDNLNDMVKQYNLFSGHRNNGVGYDIYKVAYSKELARVISNDDFATEGNYIVIKFNLLSDDSVDSIIFHTDADDIKPEGDHYDETLNGRGRSDSGREEPNYINVIGYVVPSPTQAYDIERTDDFQNEAFWTIPTYEQDKQFWNENGSLIHKTEVVVREQVLEHEGYGAYSGYLLVEKTEDGTQCYINVGNFITKPYWTYQNNMRTAASTGDFVAEYTQISDYYPVDSGGDKVEIPNGTIVLVTGVAGTSSKLNSSETEIEAIVWKEWRNGYGGVKCYFNSADLTILY